MQASKENTLIKTYELIKKNCPHIKVDSLEVVKQVEAYRNFWKPTQTNIILLAESHVYTDHEDFTRQCKQISIQNCLPAYPTQFVRFVYCLGYGEDSLLTTPTNNRVNIGTPQFWKIFCSCTAENPQETQYYRVLKTGAPSFPKRVQNKIDVLQELKKKGIWLLDASIVGLYGNQAKRDLKACMKIIDICWNNYIEKTIKEAQPKFGIVIGKGVEKIIGHKLKIPYEAIDLPSAHVSAQKHRENYLRYNQICNAILNDKPIPPKTSIKSIISDANTITSKSHETSLDFKLANLGYKKRTKNEWSKNNQTIHIVASKDFEPYTRITWKEKWRNDHAIIFDYSNANGPICIVSRATLFQTVFVREKRKTEAYANSGYWWTQKFPKEHELVQLALKHQNHWDLL